MSKDGGIQKTPKHCKGCVYRQGFGIGISYCNYFEAEGRLRNCPVDECPYYTSKKKKKTKKE